MNQLIGFLLLALTLFLALIIIGPFQLLFDVSSLIMILGCVFGVVFLSYGAQAFSIFKYANQPVKNQKEYFWVISFFDNLINTSIIAGVMGSLINMVTLLTTLTDNEGLNSGVSYSLLSLVYGFILAKLVLEPLKQNVLRRACVANINTNVQRHIEQNNKLAQHFTLLGIVNLVCCFIVLWLIP